MFGAVTYLGGKPANAGIFQVQSPSTEMGQGDAPFLQSQAQLAPAQSSSMLLWAVAILGGGGLLLYALMRK